MCFLTKTYPSLKNKQHGHLIQGKCPHLFSNHLHLLSYLKSSSVSSMKASTISGAINSALPTGVSSRGVVSDPPPEWNLIPEPRSKSHSLTLNICCQYMSTIYWRYISIPGWADRCTHRAHSQVWGPCAQFLSSGGTQEQRRHPWWSLPPPAPWKTS